MNEPDPGGEPPPMPAYKDRSTGLTVFGIMTILLGGMAGLGALTIPLSLMLAPANSQVSVAALVPAIAMYGVVAVALVWLGIGSILARRWARALLQIFSWSWLAFGLFEIAAMAFIMPKALANASSLAKPGQPQRPAAAMDAVMVVIFIFLSVVFVIMPAIWTYFYNSPHVKATCDARDPVPSWTDVCPLPVLALSLWSWLCLPMMLVMPFSGHFVMPFFGMFITGIPAVLFCLALAACWGVSGWLLYRVDVRGWWLILIALGIGMASTLVTFSQHDMLEMYRLMNYPPEQMEQLQKSGLFEGNTMVWLIGATMVPFVAYLVFIKSYFRREA